MKVGIVGAGIAGLGAARTLKANGYESVVFEKTKNVGGRCATRSTNGFVWDSGATSIMPRGKTLERVMLEQISTEGLVEIEKRVYVHSNLRVTPGDPNRGGKRYVYENGIAELPKRLAIGLDIRTETSIDQIHRDGDRYVLANETFDAVILTPPTPQSSMLLWSVGEERPLSAVRYRSCISILLGYDHDLPATPYFAILDPEQRHPLTWLSVESAKDPSRKPSIVAQLSREASVREFDRPDEELVGMVTTYVARLFGEECLKPVASEVVRWKYSQPEAYSNVETANPLDSKLLVAGDALLGGRVEDAYEVGVQVANRL